MGYRRIYYDKTTGIKIGEFAFDGHFIPMTIEQEIVSFTALSERNRKTFDVIELPYGAYAQDFAESNGYKVNVNTKELEFSYPDPNTPEAPQVFQKPLTMQITELKQQLGSAQEAIDFLLMGGL